MRAGDRVGAAVAVPLFRLGGHVLVALFAYVVAGFAGGAPAFGHWGWTGVCAVAGA
ncbi:hypothetical protein ACFV2Z_05810 [Streptomyces sp. NPDC059688]|uniref:hypothetical protein n=1 Tax=Streptomyces sp. NPDC059688 TaxID=3346906 RepID=UPI0036CEA46E